MPPGSGKGFAFVAVIPHVAVVKPARRLNPVLGVDQFRLQLEKILVGLELRVIFHHHEQLFQRVHQLDLVAGLVGRVHLVPSAATWGWIAAITIGPQLLGHTLINAVLQRLDAVLVSVAILFEIVGASLLAWWWFGESPPGALYPAAALLLAGVVLVISGTRESAPVD